MEEYNDWKKEYYQKKKIELSEEFTSKDLEIIKRLGIVILENKYSESEFEELYSMILSFYNSDDDRPRDTLAEMSVTEEEYLEILEKFKRINEKYNF